jgi:hypothetical protein
MPLAAAMAYTIAVCVYDAFRAPEPSNDWASCVQAGLGILRVLCMTDAEVKCTAVTYTQMTVPEKAATDEDSEALSHAHRLASHSHTAIAVHSEASVTVLCSFIAR